MKILGIIYNKFSLIYWRILAIIFYKIVDYNLAIPKNNLISFKLCMRPVIWDFVHPKFLKMIHLHPAAHQEISKEKVVFLDLLTDKKDNNIILKIINTPKILYIMTVLPHIKINLCSIPFLLTCHKNHGDNILRRNHLGKVNTHLPGFTINVKNTKIKLLY